MEAIAFRDEMRQAGEVESLLASMGDANERLAVAADASGRAEHAARLNRAREVLFDFSSEFKRASSALARRRESAELFRGARGGGGGGGGGGKSATGHLMDESKSIQNSLTSTSGVLGQAAEVKNSLLRQRAALSGALGRMGGVAEGLPGVQRIIDAIHRKRIRENMVLGTVIGVLICVCLWYVLF